LPSDPDNYCRQRDILPWDLPDRPEQARILITNDHASFPRERGDAARLTKAILARGAPNVDRGTPHDERSRFSRSDTPVPRVPPGPV
jgi:hypothetical protein